MMTYSLWFSPARGGTMSRCVITHTHTQTHTTSGERESCVHAKQSVDTTGQFSETSVIPKCIGFTLENVLERFRPPTDQNIPLS